MEDAMTNVIALHAEDDETDGAGTALDALYARYLKADARFRNPKAAEGVMGNASAEATRLVWEIIQTRTVYQYQIAYKLRLLRELLEGADLSWTDGRERMLLESIRIDVGA
jgi:hypothetical protein